MPKPAKVVSITSGGHVARVRERRDELVLTHLSLAEGIARHVHRRLPPSFDLVDLIATANLALLHAAALWNPEKYPQFGVFARYTIRGAVLDSDPGGRRYTENTRPGIERVVAIRDDAPPVLDQYGSPATAPDPRRAPRAGPEDAGRRLMAASAAARRSARVLRGGRADAAGSRRTIANHPPGREGGARGRDPRAASAYDGRRG